MTQECCTFIKYHCLSGSATSWNQKTIIRNHTDGKWVDRSDCKNVCLKLQNTLKFIYFKIYLTFIDWEMVFRVSITSI